MRGRIAGLAALIALALGVGACESQRGVADEEGELPCPLMAEADYPLEPTFGTPEEALEHALETEPPLVTGPGDADEYHKVDQGEGWIDFEFRDGDEAHHVWELRRDDDGRWGMVARGGCFPRH